ncbi:hypothetical protein L4D06_06005 [Enterovibrio makurazakiensis]|uniref:Uncharacterized protein n=1 Tax=Enterovibrio gelatinilyticus TaxID=2899819 RepID=A0ABT5QX60_9GAMM|nr:hypothetical protein [Enterovibrio sp. ZSDZ42]MDD1792116.1 hypothetical protein [Enterovibrio sp. ZSDZ42]
MPKYQFFCKPDSNRKEFTYADMGSETFLAEKNQLIDLGFEVEDDVIYAETTEEAVQKFKSNFLAPLEDYANSTPSGGAATFVFELYKSAFGKNKQS